jgi:hypothetical protein
MISRIGPEEYEELCRAVGTAVAEVTPPQSVVAVISKGDPKLVELEGRSGLHFPSDAEGRYAGFHPRTSEEAIAQLDTARAAGAEYLCIPASAFWWLEHYQGFGNWLGAHCRSVGNDPDACVIYELMRSPAQASSQPGADGQVRALLDSLLPERALLFTLGFAGESVAAEGRTVTALSRSRAFGLRRRLAEAPDLPAFVLISRGAGEAPMEPALERSLSAIATPVARREHLCDLLQVNALDSRSKIGQSPQGDQPSGPPPTLDGEAVNKLSKRLERLGLPGEDDASTGKGRE